MSTVFPPANVAIECMFRNLSLLSKIKHKIKPYSLTTSTFPHTNESEPVSTRLSPDIDNSDALISAINYDDELCSGPIRRC